ncbi:undecaprenyl-diphosphate phosphatase [Kineosporia succinea]|uniref:Undecaprenyl-diphosphatase n=1 Tax=Kineosporia succinea TaxID=84632 RepID=A0ABT9PCZ4_9ACTN|nr:undecaprenyl-diphosphate phosphatase [Kineosporia succinea]MDP9830357.1 undecaprenyl-diphosphatase [Kineosporia succinea]
MTGWGQSAVLGVVQGLTEFLPISSSAHLRVVATLLGWSDPGAAFTAVTQLGTEAAVLGYFRSDIRAIVSIWFVSLGRPALRRDPAARLGWYVILGTIPIAALGLLLQSAIESTFRDLRLIALTLIAFGLLLGAADAVGDGRRTMEHLTLRHALTIGLAQCLALVPGVSRSGGTISAALFLGYSRTAAARYAFLLAIPAVLASGLLELTKIGGADSPAWGPTALATVISFVVGYAVIAWLLRYLAHGSFKPFVVYRVGLGLLLLVLVTIGAVPASP